MDSTFKRWTIKFLRVCLLGFRGKGFSNDSEVTKSAISSHFRCIYLQNLYSYGHHYYTATQSSLSVFQWPQRALNVWPWMTLICHLDTGIGFGVGLTGFVRVTFRRNDFECFVGRTWQVRLMVIDRYWHAVSAPLKTFPTRFVGLSCITSHNWIHKCKNV